MSKLSIKQIGKDETKIFRLYKEIGTLTKLNDEFEFEFSHVPVSIGTKSLEDLWMSLIGMEL